MLWKAPGERPVRITQTATATVESGRQRSCGVSCESQETPARDRRPGNEVRTRARHSQTRASLDIEKGVLPCHQLHRRLHLLGMGHGTGARRPRGPWGVRPHEVLRQDAPEPWMRSGLVVYDDIVYTFRGVKNQWHDDTPSRRLLRRKAGAASGGAARMQALVRRRKRNSPQSTTPHLWRTI